MPVRDSGSCLTIVSPGCRVLINQLRSFHFPVSVEPDKRGIRIRREPGGRVREIDDSRDFSGDAKKKMPFFPSIISTPLADYNIVMVRLYKSMPAATVFRGSKILGLPLTRFKKNQSASRISHRDISKSIKIFGLIVKVSAWMITGNLIQ